MALSITFALIIYLIITLNLASSLLIRKITAVGKSLCDSAFTCVTRTSNHASCPLLQNPLTLMSSLVLHRHVACIIKQFSLTHLGRLNMVRPEHWCRLRSAGKLEGFWCYRVLSIIYDWQSLKSLLSDIGVEQTTQGAGACRETVRRFICSNKHCICIGVHQHTHRLMGRVRNATVMSCQVVWLTA